MTAPRVGGWMQAYSGGKFWPGDPRPEEVNIADIAHALSLLCRFGGHCKDFYSVAEHSVLVSRLVPPEHALAGLLHDATEAYVVDTPRPLKRQLPEYRRIERLNWLAIAAAFNLPADLPQCVHDADDAILLVERDALLPVCEGWGYNENASMDTSAVVVCSLPPPVAKIHFLNRFTELTR